MILAKLKQTFCFQPGESTVSQKYSQQYQKSFSFQPWLHVCDVATIHMATGLRFLMAGLGPLVGERIPPLPGNVWGWISPVLEYAARRSQNPLAVADVPFGVPSLGRRGSRSWVLLFRKKQRPLGKPEEAKGQM